MQSLINSDDRVSTTLTSTNLNDLPAMTVKGEEPSKEEKSFKIPGKFTVEKVIEYLYNESGLSKYLISSSFDKANPTAHLELLLQSNILAPEDGQLQMIVLDNHVTITSVRNLLWRNMNKDADPKSRLPLFYRRKQY